MYGFTINKLMLTGSTVNPVSVEFKKGLNIISGPSDTGKTYIFECINFMLGATESPKNIPEAKGYKTVLLELNTDTKIITLERQLNGGKINLYPSNIDDMASVTPNILAETHIAGKTNNISGYLLNLSGFNKTHWIKRNENNKKNTLSFRYLRNYITISEERIISKNTPIHSGQFVLGTLEKYLLKLLLTGKDDNKLDEIEKPEITKAKLHAKIEILDEMITKTRSELKAFDSEVSIHGDVMKKLDSLKSEYNIINHNIDNLNLQRKESLENIKLKEAKFSVIKQLLLRFDLLNKQYDADIKRLEFINEGSHYFSQLNTVNCPLCGKSIKEDKCQPSFKYDTESTNASYLAEIKKIQLNKRDLEKSHFDLSEEMKEVQAHLSENKRKYKEIENQLNEVLHPMSGDIKDQIDNILKMKRISVERNTLNEKLEAFLTLRESINNPNDSPKLNTTNITDLLKLINNSGFSDYILDILVEWDLEVKDEMDIKLDEVTVGRSKVIELLISDKRRSDFGKGYRALLYSAFVIALIKFCKDKNLPHPGFVLLDSPVTTFKEAKQEDKNNNDVISNDIQQSFFKDLSKSYQDIQIIILENKVPPLSIKGDINYIQFTKSQTHGRYGFFDPS